MIQPLTFDEFKMLAKYASRVAVFQEFPAQTFDAVLVYHLMEEMYGKGVIF